MSPTMGPMMNASPALWQQLHYINQQQLHYTVSRARIFKLLKSPGSYSKKSIPPAYVA